MVRLAEWASPPWKGVGGTPGFGVTGTWDPVPALLLTGWVTLGKSLNISEPHYSWLLIEDNNFSVDIRLNEITHVDQFRTTAWHVASWPKMASIQVPIPNLQLQNLKALKRKHIWQKNLSWTNVKSFKSFFSRTWYDDPWSIHFIAEISTYLDTECCPHPARGITKYTVQGTSLVVQWLRLHASTAGGAGLISGWGTKIPCVL